MFIKKSKMGEDKKKIESLCDFYRTRSFDEFLVKVVGWKRSCRYHRKIGQILNFENIVPKDFCIFAYHSVYSYILSLLYDGKVRNNNGLVKVFCPGTDSYICMDIQTKKRKFVGVYNLAEKCFRMIGMPQDIIDKEVDINVSDVKGVCPKNIKKGSVFKFNIADQLELCPASFNTMLPFIMSKLGNSKKNIMVQCPSEACKIKYKIDI